MSGRLTTESEPRERGCSGSEMVEIRSCGVSELSREERAYGRGRMRKHARPPVPERCRKSWPVMWLEVGEVATHMNDFCKTYQKSPARQSAQPRHRPHYPDPMTTPLEHQTPWASSNSLWPLGWILAPCFHWRRLSAAWSAGRWRLTPWDLRCRRPFSSCSELVHTPF